MKLISGHFCSNIIIDIGTGEKIDISKLNLDELEELQHQVELSDIDFEALQSAIINSRVGWDESRRDMLKEIAKNNKVIKIAEEFGDIDSPQRPTLHPQFNVVDAIKNNDDASKFVFETMAVNPVLLPSLLGMKQDELHKNIMVNLRNLLRITPRLLEDFDKANLKTYDAVVKLIVDLLYQINPPMASLKNIICPLLGMKTNSNELVKRLHDYVPIVIKGKENIEEALEDDSGKQKQSINNILDMYNAGKITKDQMQTMMKEFAGYIPCFIRTASGIKIGWKEDVIKVTKTADGRYRASKNAWSRIGIKMGWLKIG